MSKDVIKGKNGECVLCAAAAVPPAPHRSSPADELYSYSSDVVMLASAKPDARFPVRPALEFEPNRPDFKVLSRYNTTRGLHVCRLQYYFTII